MNELNFIFVWLAGWMILSNMTNFTVLENVNGKYERRWGITAAFLVFFPIFWIACMGTPRSDTWLYITIFESFPANWGEFLENVSLAKSGQCFQLLQFVIKRLFGNNEVAFRVILALIHSIPVVLICRKYSENYLMTIFLFVASALHVSWMMNGIRQFIAAVIIFAATPLLLERRLVALTAIILFATSFHASAILMLPVVFIVQGKAWNKKTLFYIVVALIAMYIFNNYTGVIDMMLKGTEYEGAVQNWQAMGDDGTNPIRVFVNAIPMLLALIARNYVKYENDELLNICVNMSVVTTGLYLISMVTSGIMVGRLPIYTNMYNLILLPNLIPKMFTENSTRMVKLIMSGCYMLYYMIEVGF